MSKKDTYFCIYLIICAFAGLFFSLIGYSIITMQWWISLGMIWASFWCGINCSNTFFKENK